VRFHQRVRVGFERPNVDRCWIKVVEVDGAHDFFGDAGGESDGDTVALAGCGVPGALAAEMSGVSEIPPRLMLELVPLAKEVVAVVVAAVQMSSYLVGMIGNTCFTGASR